MSRPPFKQWCRSGCDHMIECMLVPAADPSDKGAAGGGVQRGGAGVEAVSHRPVRNRAQLCAALRLPPPGGRLTNPPCAMTNPSAEPREIFSHPPL